MGYSTDFDGGFRITPALRVEDLSFLQKLNKTRRMARKVGPEYGVEGEFFVDGGGDFGQDESADVIDNNKPPKTQPGLWCQWVPNEDGTELVWDQGEKFYEYVKWLQYLIERVLKPRGYVLNGACDWRGESDDDRGTIYVDKNVVSVSEYMMVEQEKQVEQVDEVLSLPMPKSTAVPKRKRKTRDAELERNMAAFKQIPRGYTLWALYPTKAKAEESKRLYGCEDDIITQVGDMKYFALYGREA
jgi:hypothetical protein